MFFIAGCKMSQNFNSGWCSSKVSDSVCRMDIAASWMLADISMLVSRTKCLPPQTVHRGRVEVQQLPHKVGWLIVSSWARCTVFVAWHSPNLLTCQVRLRVSFSRLHFQTASMLNLANAKVFLPTLRLILYLTTAVRVHYWLCGSCFLAVSRVAAEHVVQKVDEQPLDSLEICSAVSSAYQA